MVPRMRTVGGCCAHVADPSTVTSASEASTRGTNEDIFGMVFPSGILVERPVQGEYPAGMELFRKDAAATPIFTQRRRGLLHRRRQAIAADADAVGFEQAVRQLLHKG